MPPKIQRKKNRKKQQEQNEDITIYQIPPQIAIIDQPNKQQIPQEQVFAEEDKPIPYEDQFDNLPYKIQEIKQPQPVQEVKTVEKSALENIIILFSQCTDINMPEESRSTLIELMDEQIEMSSQDLEEAFRSLKEKLTRQLSTGQPQEIQEIPNQKTCQQCKKSKNFLDFPKQHLQKEICQVCIYNLIRKQKQNTLQTHSISTLSQQYIYQYQICKACGNNVNKISDFTGRICNQCFMCYNCLLFSYNCQQCIVCQNQIQRKQYTQLRTLLFDFCQECKEQVNSPYMVQKNCCEREICGVCQLDYSTVNCLGCEVELTNNTISLLNSIRSAILEMDL